MITYILFGTIFVFSTSLAILHQHLKKKKGANYASTVTSVGFIIYLMILISLCEIGYIYLNGEL